MINNYIKTRIILTSTFLATLFFMLMSFYSSGQIINEEWSRTYDEKNPEVDLKVACDSEGYIYIAGTFDTPENGIDWKVICVHPNGDILFTKTFDGGYGEDNLVKNIAIDKNDCVLITGSFAESSELSNIATVKIDKSGVIQWQVVSGYSNGLNTGEYISVGPLNNVYVGSNINDNGNPDVVIHKYDPSGIELWNYSLNTPDIEKIKDIDIYSNGDIAVLCNVYKNSTWDIMLASISESGDLNFENSYEGDGGLDDEGYDLAIDSNNDVYVVGYSVNDGHKDFVTIKWDVNGDMHWYAFFDEIEDEDEALGILITNDLIIVSGNVTSEDLGVYHKDIVTIAYNSDGLQIWKQKFDGPNSSDDSFTKIISNPDNEIIISASVQNDELNYDSYLLNYEATEGILEWRMIHNNELNIDDLAADIDIDFLGNIYVTTSVTDGDISHGSLIKYNQPIKYTPEIENLLKMLIVGMTNNSANETVKEIVYASCSETVDDFYNISFSNLIDGCLENNYDLQAEMNAEISVYYSLSSEVDHVDYIFKRLWVLGRKIKPVLAVPHYHHFEPQELSADPKLSYSFKEKTYPIPCINCENSQLSKSTSMSNVSWVALLTAPPWYYINGAQRIIISSCHANTNPSSSFLNVEFVVLIKILDLFQLVLHVQKTQVVMR